MLKYAYVCMCLYIHGHLHICTMPLNRSYLNIYPHKKENYIVIPMK